MPQRRSQKPTISIRVELSPQENAIVERVKAKLMAEGNDGITKAGTIAWLVRRHEATEDPRRVPRALDLLERHIQRHLEDQRGSDREVGLEEALSLLLAFRTALAGRDWELPAAPARDVA